MDFGDEPEGSDSQRQRKRYHRHTPRQIQQLEAMFKECPHPDENQRAALSRELGLEPRQIKFWFQNRRTQMKVPCAARARGQLLPARGERQDPGREHHHERGAQERHLSQLRRPGGRRGLLRRAEAPHGERPPQGRAGPVVERHLQVPRPAVHADAAGAAHVRVVAGPVRGWDARAGSRRRAVAGPGPPQRVLVGDAVPHAGARDGNGAPHDGRHGGARHGRAHPARAGRRAGLGQGRARGRAGDAQRHQLRQPLRQARRRVPPAGHQRRGVQGLGARLYERRRARRRLHGHEQVDGVLPRHRVQGAHRRRPRQRLGRQERVLDHDVRGAPHHDPHRPDPRVQLPPLLQADRAGPVGRRRRLPGRAARRALRHAVPLAPPPVGVPHSRHVQWLLQGDMGRTHGDRADAPHQLALPQPGAQRRRVRGAPVARRAAARVRALRVPRRARCAAPRPWRSDAGGEAEHDEAVASDGEQLLREPELVAAAAVDAAVGHHGREHPRFHSPQRRPRPAQQRRPQRRHLHLAARPRRPRLRLRPRRERAIPVGRPVARQSGSGGVARPLRLQPRQLHLPAERAECEPEQHADPARELHGRVGVAGGVLADRHPGGERGDERRGPIGHPAAAVGLRHLPRRPTEFRRRGPVPQRQHAGAPAGLCRHHRVPDPRQQPAVVQAQRRVRRHRQQPHRHHRAADQGGTQLRRRLIIFLFHHRLPPPRQLPPPPPQ